MPKKLNMKFQTQPPRERRLLYAGALLVSLGLALLICAGPLYDLLVRKSITLAPASEAFRRWRTTDDLVMDFYFFNWTNTGEVHGGAARPRVEEVGPYRFRFAVERVNVSWPREGVVRYRDLRRYYYDEGSPRKLSDVVTTLNALALSMAHYCKSCSFFNKKLVSLTLSTTSDVHVTRPVSELLFDGYTDSLVSAVGMLPIDLGAELDRFGFFYDRNGTRPEDGWYEMVAANEGDDFGRLVSWDNKTESPHFRGECAEVAGSFTGAFFPAKPSRQMFRFFEGGICRPAPFVHVEDVQVKGLPALKFSGRHMFDNGTAIPQAFCEGEPFRAGVLNISGCAGGSPTFLSLPHFYGADPHYADAVEGMRPVEGKHDFWFALEEDTGVPIDVAARTQVNMLLEPIDGITLYQDVPKVVFPIFYTENRHVIEDDLALYLRIFRASPAIFTGVAALMIVLGSVCVLYVCVRSRTKTKSTTNGDVSRAPEVEPLKS